MFLLLLLVSQHASGLVQVYKGEESVLLPCQVPAEVSRSSTALVWSRNEFTLPMVHMRQQNSDDLTKQNHRYHGRTWMRVDALQTGELSLTLRSPTYSDSGNYTCIARSFGEDLKKIYVQLKVSEPPPPVWPDVRLFPIFLLLLTVLCFFLICMYHAYETVKNRAVCMLNACEVTEGAESVVLPWRKDGDLPAAVRLKWTRVEPSNGEICRCVKDQGQWKLHPDPGYKDHVQMDQLTKTDFSLTLKNPLCKDGGVYHCTVYDKGGKLLKETTVPLWVKETWWKTFKRLFLCCEDTAPSTDADKWSLTEEVSEMLKKSYGRLRLS